MSGKRGQIALFIIIGMVILIAAGIFIYARVKVVEKEAEVLPADIAPIKLYVDKCLEETAKDAVLYVALHGGYYTLPEKSLAFQNINMREINQSLLLITIPFYVYEEEMLIPTKESMEHELSLYINSEFPKCIDVTQLEEKGYALEFGKLNVTSKLVGKRAYFEATFPIKISFDGEEHSISRFSTSFDNSINNLYDVASLYSSYQILDPSVMFISKLIRYSAQHNITFKTSNSFTNDTIIFLIDNETLIKNQPLIFTFAVKHTEFDIKKYESSVFGLEESNHTIVTKNEYGISEY